MVKLKASSDRSQAIVIHK